VVDVGLTAVATLSVEVNRAGYRQLRRFAAGLPQVRWAIEGAAGLGAPLTERLRADGVTVIDVPGKASPTGAAAVHRPRPQTRPGRRPLSRNRRLVCPHAAHRRSRRGHCRAAALNEHRDDLVRTRAQLINRLHTLLVKLVPSGLPRGLTAESAAEALRRIRPHNALGRTLRRLAVELVGALRRLDRRIADATQTLADAVAASGTTLTQLLGVGDVVAAKLLARTGPISRFPSAAAFASFCGVAPIEVSSGDVVRHRLSRAGDRQLNYALYVMAMTRFATTRRDGPTTNANAPPVRATRRRCAVSNAASPTSSAEP
jgi:transposase